MPVDNAASSASAHYKDVATVRRSIAEYVAVYGQRKVLDALLGTSARLILLGETHFVGDYAKATLIAALIHRATWAKPVVTHFHASERLSDCDQTTRAIEAILSAPDRSRIKMRDRLDASERVF